MLDEVLAGADVEAGLAAPKLKPVEGAVPELPPNIEGVDAPEVSLELLNNPPGCCAESVLGAPNGLAPPVVAPPLNRPPACVVTEVAGVDPKSPPVVFGVLLPPPKRFELPLGGVKEKPDMVTGELARRGRYFRGC